MSDASLAALESRHPEWRPWLALVGRALEEVEAGWPLSLMPPSDAPVPNAPLMAGARIAVPAAAVERYFAQLCAASGAYREGPLWTLASLRRSAQCATAVLAAAVNADEARLRGMAEEAHADAEALRAVGALLAMPLLHACRTPRESAARPHWDHGYCPVCASWPAYAETRGVERSRYLRCAACGSGWATQPLRCAYCGTADHDALGMLVPEARDAQLAIEVCRRCNGYVKVRTTLLGSAPRAVLLEDLATVDLDIAAAGRGYRRPQGPACALAASVVADAHSGAQA